MRGLLITFEGVEGSGKSTQARLLYRELEQRGVPTVLSREPGGTPIGEKVRDILLDRRFPEMHARTELLLYLASRNQHVHEKLLPAIRTGRVVISDRYTESSLAYQGGGRELTFNMVSRLDKFATAGLRPDLVLIVDLPPEVGRARMKDAPRDRLESERAEFHESVRQAYIRLAHRAPKRIRLVDGRRPQPELFQEILGIVVPVLVRRGLIKEQLAR